MKSVDRRPSGLDRQQLLAETTKWLYAETRDEVFIEEILEKMCVRLRDAGIPVARAALYFSTQNPEWLGARILWRVGAAIDVGTFGYDIRTQPEFLLSPMRELAEGSSEVRMKLEGDERLSYPLYQELRAAGVTDYVAWNLHHSLGRTHTVTFGADGLGGFSHDDIAVLRELLPVLALVTEVRLKNHITRILLQTYVGRHATREILAGATTRGSGSTVEAAILICDMRDFTGLSDTLERDEIISLLNDFFDAMAVPVENHGGEILKFVGDGFMAIFPTTDEDACQNLIAAVREAEKEIASYNVHRLADGLKEIDYGIGVHLGDVLYGNIGSTKRLDFTVVGPAVNVASRLENLSKQTDQRALFSDRFVEKAGENDRFLPLGRFDLRGLGEAVNVFVLADEFERSGVQRPC